MIFYNPTAGPSVSAGGVVPSLGYVPSVQPPSSGATPAGNCGCGAASVPSATGPIGSTSNPNTFPAAAIGVSSGITSPQPANPAGFLGFLNGPRIGVGWPNGGFAVPPAVAPNQSVSSQGTAGQPGNPLTPTAGQGFTAAGLVGNIGLPGLNLQTLIVVGLLYAAYKAFIE